MRNVRDSAEKEQYDALEIRGYKIPEIRYADDTFICY
jgi:hypothetical protein